MELIVAILLVMAFIKYYWTKKEDEYKASLLTDHLALSEELKNTLAMGLYFRFSKENSVDSVSYSTIFQKQDPIQFETFVSEVIEKAKGGSTWVTSPTRDFGVDFEHETEKGIFLGQVKCYQGDLSFEPIALIHSNIMKKGAVGGYVVTTGSFTKGAHEYAKGLNIELIDGIKLVNYWITTFNKSEQEIKGLLPDFI
ncbi:MAG TPA: restriction endonuclease [Niallia sp.]|nr:restriction endonuclease [Niallia sp.]